MNNVLLNISCILVTLETFHIEIPLPTNELQPLNSPLIFVTLETFQLEILTLNNVLSENILSISVTLETFHPEISPVTNNSQPWNIPLISVTLETFHVERSPPTAELQSLNIPLVSVWDDISQLLRLLIVVIEEQSSNKPLQALLASDKSGVSETEFNVRFEHPLKDEPSVSWSVPHCWMLINLFRLLPWTSIPLIVPVIVTV